MLFIHIVLSVHPSEISLNSRNPAAQITIIPKNQISPDWVLPDLPHSFICGYVYKITIPVSFIVLNWNQRNVLSDCALQAGASKLSTTPHWRHHWCCDLCGSTRTCQEERWDVRYTQKYAQHASSAKILKTFPLTDGQRSEIEEYRWLQLADRTSDKPIMIKLFSTSQPDIQSRIYPSK